MIVVVMGFSGSGKSFIASILHQDFGFEWIRSDVIRKELAGLKQEERVRVGFGESIYSEEWTKRVYHAAGKDVVLDATFLKKWQRKMVEEYFDKVLFLMAEAQEEEIERRLHSREDISDADFSVYLKQKEIFEPPEKALIINTQRSKEEIKAELQKVLGIPSASDSQEPCQDLLRP